MFRPHTIISHRTAGFQNFRRKWPKQNFSSRCQVDPSHLPFFCLARWDPSHQPPELLKENRGAQRIAMALTPGQGAGLGGKRKGWHRNWQNWWNMYIYIYTYNCWKGNLSYSWEEKQQQNNNLNYFAVFFWTPLSFWSRWWGHHFLQDVLWAQRPDGVVLTIDLNEAQDIKAEVGDEELWLLLLLLLLWLWLFSSIFPCRKTYEHVKCKIRDFAHWNGNSVKFGALCCATDSRKKKHRWDTKCEQSGRSMKRDKNWCPYVVKSISLARSALQNRCH